MGYKRPYITLYPSQLSIRELHTHSAQCSEVIPKLSPSEQPPLPHELYDPRHETPFLTEEFFELPWYDDPS